MIKNYNPHENRHKIQWHLLIKTLAPLSHIGEVSGNQSNLRTEKITDIEGNKSDVFTFSGNALRNYILRRLGIKAALDRLDITLTPTQHHTFFCGGSIDGSTGNDLELDRNIRKLLPWLSVLGTAKPKDIFNSKDAQMIAGRINVGAAYLVCWESALQIYQSFAPAIPYDCLEGIAAIAAAKAALENARVSAWLGTESPDIEELAEEYKRVLAYWKPFLIKQLGTNNRHLTYRQQVRQDSHKDPGLAKYLPAPEPKGQLSLLGDDKPKKDKEKKSQQMIMGDWLISAGCQLYSRWDGNITDIEEGFIVDSLLNFAKSPYIGGKGNTGCGRVSIQIFYKADNSAGQYLLIDDSSEGATLGSRCQIIMGIIVHSSF